MEEEKKEVGTQVKLENEKTGHLVCKRMRSGEPRSTW